MKVGLFVRLFYIAEMFVKAGRFFTENQQTFYLKSILQKQEEFIMKKYDIAIIGAGVSGTAIARELSRYQTKICVLEREEDVCCGTSKANSAIIHAGYDAEPGSLKAKLNLRGNQMMDQLAKDLDFPFRRTGSLVLCLDEKDLPNLQKLYERGITNGVKGLRILNKEEVRAMETNISDQVIAALYAPTGGIVCPFHMTIAFAENA